MGGTDHLRAELDLRGEKRQPRDAVAVGEHVERPPRNVSSVCPTDIGSEKRQWRLVSDWRERPAQTVVGDTAVEDHALVAGETDEFTRVVFAISSRCVQSHERLADLDDGSVAVPRKSRHVHVGDDRKRPLCAMRIRVARAKAEVDVVRNPRGEEAGANESAE